jgi:Winged helix domain
MADKKKAPDAATSKGQPKRVEAFDNPHIAHDARSSKLIVRFRSSEGNIWAYRGKRARVLSMLANAPNGVTQYDTFPWHTRLGGTIHAMREDGLSITTEREGEFRHARYRLATAGCLLLQAKNTRGGT